MTKAINLVAHLPRKVICATDAIVGCLKLLTFVNLHVSMATGVSLLTIITIAKWLNLNGAREINY